jgi:hypothetical protein
MNKSMVFIMIFAILAIASVIHLNGPWFSEAASSGVRPISHTTVCVEGFKFIVFWDTFPNMAAVQLFGKTGDGLPSPIRCKEDK